jgi:hypothetical protein
VVAANHRGAQLQAGAGIAASRLHVVHDSPATIPKWGRVSFPRDPLEMRPDPFRGGENMTTGTRVALALAGLLLLASCAARGVRIAELKDQPSRYDHRTVSISGVVTTSWGIPLAPVQFYNVDDGSGEITVLSRSGRVLSKGTRVRVKGRVNQVASFGTRSVGLHFEERDRDIR